MPEREIEVHSRECHEMCRSHFNEPMLSFGVLVRCIGYAETGVDCYIITKLQGGEVRWNTCVGGYVFLDRLKGQDAGGGWDDLLRLDSDLENLGATKEAEFRLDLRHDDMERPQSATPSEEDR